VTQTRARPLHPISFLRALRARPRLLACGALGAAIFVALRLSFGQSAPASLLVAWNVGAGLYLFFAWRIMKMTAVQGIRLRALRQDEGRHAILILVLLAVLVVLLAVGTQLAQVKDLHGRARSMHVTLAAVTVMTSWLFTQVLFALHYAHDFYMARNLHQDDPLLFPGTADPGYADFFHFSCVIGTSAQTADISFNGSSLRPIGTLHCIVAFFFNATLLALTINLAAGLLL
jgi:uncharacterized membrane protein